MARACRPNRPPPTAVLHGAIRLLAWTLCAAAALMAAMAAPLAAGRLYVRNDLGAFHLPVRGSTPVAWRRGEPFDWMPSLFAECT